jgi:hypothetical protein
VGRGREFLWRGAAARPGVRGRRRGVFRRGEVAVRRWGARFLSAAPSAPRTPGFVLRGDSHHFATGGYGKYGECGIYRISRIGRAR